MNDFNDIRAKATTYFENDLNSKVWYSVEESAKNGALKLAILDVKTILNKYCESVDLEDETTQAAIFEQAIFLIIQKQLLDGGNQINKEAINDIGSTSYFPNNYSKDYYIKEKISSRTLALLKKEKKIVKIIR